jgi:hypothetical protein
MCKINLDFVQPYVISMVASPLFYHKGNGVNTEDSQRK